MTVTASDLARALVLRTRTRQAAEERQRLEVMHTLREAVPLIAEELSLGHVWVIGSAAWGGFGLRSDVDLVVEHGERTGARVELADRVGSLLGRVVEVLPLAQVVDSLRRRTLAEGVRVA